MSSGEVLFILAFIVLPTAVLVSSAWAILFVRRRPNQVVEYSDVEARSADTDASGRFDVVDTVVLPTVDKAGAARSAQPGEEDNGETASHEDSLEDASQTDDTLDIQRAASDMPYADTSGNRTGALEESVCQVSTDAGMEEDSDFLQSTDDLNAVVAEVAAIDAQDDQSPPLSDEDEAVDDDTDTYETSDLPILQPREQPVGTSQPDSERAPEPDARDNARTPEPAGSVSESRWKRRKRPAPLRPNDPEAGRTRGRSRDPQRQVPQLGRSSRKRDETSRDTDVGNDDTT